MALGTLATVGLKLGAGLAASKLGAKSGKKFARQTALPEFQAPKFNAGGLTGRGGEISSNAARQGLVGDIAATFPEQAGQIGQLRGLVTPGIGALTQSRLQGLGNRARSAIGNLRDNIARRRISGSSFANDALTRANLEFAQEEDKVRSESFLTELDLNNQLLEQEFNARRGEFETGLNELNFQADVASKLQSGTSQILAQNAQFRAQMQQKASEFGAKSSAGFGQLFGNVIEGLGGGGGGNLAGIGNSLAASTRIA